MPTYLILVLCAVALAAAATGTVILWRWRSSRLKRRLRKVAPRLKYPVVLAHGLMGFDQLRLGSRSGAYFRGVEPRLQRLGAKVYAFRVRPAASIAARAEELAAAIRAIDADRVNIIAHSMGGLDARYLASQLGLSKKVASVTTIGTPHRGTPLADLGAGLSTGAAAVNLVLRKLGVDADGFFDLTTEKMTRFNQSVPDAKGVFYGSWVARAPGLPAINPLLLPTWKLILARIGENDGMVPLASQEWGEVCGRIDADHWAQIGWSLSFDAPAFYEDLVKDLMRRGL